MIYAFITGSATVSYDPGTAGNLFLAKSRRRERRYVDRQHDQ
jgi:hypothetical protein